MSLNVDADLEAMSNSAFGVEGLLQLKTHEFKYVRAVTTNERFALQHWGFSLRDNCLLNYCRIHLGIVINVRTLKGRLRQYEFICALSDLDTAV